MDFRSQLSAFQNKGGGSSGDRRSYNQSTSPGGDGGYRGNNRGRDYSGRGRGRSDFSGRGRPRDWIHSPGPPHSRRRIQSPDRDGLDELRSYDYRIPKGVPPAPTARDKARQAKHLAILLICIEDLPYEHIWKEWIRTMEENFFVSFVCHAKYPDRVKSDWLKQRLLLQPPRVGRGNSFLDPEFLTHKPEWGSVEITRAMVDLLQEAIKIGVEKEKDPRFSTNRYVAHPPYGQTGEVAIPVVDQFLFVSETCLPVRTAQEVFERVADTTVSWVHAGHRHDEGTPKNKYEDDQFASIHRRIPGQYRWKADQWVLLCRHHATRIVEADRPHKPFKHQLWHMFRDVPASDEMYFPTMLAVLGYLRFTANGENTQRTRSTYQDIRSPTSSGAQSNSEVETDQVLKRPATYTDWTEGMRNPASFTKGISDFERVARLARGRGCLLARKFAPFLAIPGVPPEEQKITGQISAEEWFHAVKAMKAFDDEKKATEAPATDTQSNGGSSHGLEKSEREDQSEVEVQASEPSITAAVSAPDSEEPAPDDDEDEEENELE